MSHAKKVPWMAHANRSLQGRIDQTEIAETVATTLEIPSIVIKWKYCDLVLIMRQSSNTARSNQVEAKS